MMKVLAIDDNEDDIEILRMEFEDLGWKDYEILSSSDWPGGERILADEEIHLIFLDYCLGPTSGLEILQHILEQDTVHPPVIMLTGQGSEETAVEAIKCGAEDYLVKGRLTGSMIEKAVTNALEKGLLKKRVAEQESELLEAERQRVMFESVGAACHHFAQPLTTMIGYLQMLQADPRLDEERRKVFFDTCLDSANRMADILDRFQTVREYRTRPYSRNGAILDIGIYEEDEVRVPSVVNGLEGSS